MKKSISLALVVLFAFTACQSTTPVTDTTDKKVADLKSEETTAKSDFQSAAATMIETDALTIDEISAFFPETDSVTEADGKERTGFGGTVFNVESEGETVAVISYFTFESMEALEENYQLLYDSTPEVEDLAFAEKAFLAPLQKKVIFVNDSFKFDVRYVGANTEQYSAETLQAIAKTAYNKAQ